jgi:hypothetical protein
MTTPHPAADGPGWQGTMFIPASDDNIMVLVAVY